jgi:hypothetical protein
VCDLDEGLDSLPDANTVIIPGWRNLESAFLGMICADLIMA